jgi:hypothetical protein
LASELPKPYFEAMRDRAEACAEWLGNTSLEATSLPDKCEEFGHFLLLSQKEQFAIHKEKPFATPPKYRSESGAAFMDKVNPSIQEKQKSAVNFFRVLGGFSVGLSLLWLHNKRQDKRLH